MIAALPVSLALAEPLLAHMGPGSRSVALENRRLAPGLKRVATPPLRTLEDAPYGRAWYQIHVEQHVIIRIAPGSSQTRQHELANLPHRADLAKSRYKQVPYHGCIRIDGIDGVSANSGNQLFLFTRDHGVMAASLKQSCPAQAFYSGFYVERSKDGRLCASRDILHSRSGQSCAIQSLSRVVARGD